MLRVIAFAICMLAALPAAQATVIGILSEGTAVDPLESNSASGSNVVIAPVGVWATAPPAAWVSFTPGTGAGGVTPADGTFVTFAQPFFLPGPTNTGSVTVWADDTASVLLDLAEVLALNPLNDSACADGPIGCEMGEGALIDLTGLSAGPHLLEFKVLQRAGDGYGLLYAGSVDSVAEPGTFLLLGAGLLAVGRFAREKLYPKRNRKPETAIVSWGSKEDPPPLARPREGRAWGRASHSVGAFLIAFINSASVVRRP